MSLKLLTSLGALVCFNFMYSFTQSLFLQKDYVNEVWSEGLNQQLNPICNVSYEKWAGICTYYIRKVRENPIYNSLRVSYTAFFHVPINEKCLKKNLNFLEPLPDDTYQTEQYMMHCFGRQAIVPAGKSFEEYEYYMEIVIYPKDENTMMVFQYSKTFHHSMLFEKYEGEFWPDIPEIADSSLLITPPPHIIKNQGKLYNALIKKLDLLENKDENNVVYATTEQDYQKMKIMLIKYSSVAKEGAPVYLEEIINRHSRYNEIPSSECVVLRLPRTSSTKKIFLDTYSCARRSHKTGKLIYNVRLSAGPDIHSILLLKKTIFESKYVYKIVDLIENLYLQFLPYYL